MLTLLLTCFADYLQPTLDQLGVLHDFVVESHIQYYAPLAFEPQMSRDQNGNAISALGPEELKVFVNSAEWSLGMVSPIFLL